VLALAAAHQAQGRPREAVKLLKQRLADEPLDVAAHDGISLAYQATGRREEAAQHFRRAISLGLRRADALVVQDPAMMTALGRFSRAYPRPLPLAELLGPGDEVADDGRLLALLQSECVHDAELELFLTAVCRELLMAQTASGPAAPTPKLFDLACALAAQCFLNEYVFGMSDA